MNEQFYIYGKLNQSEIIKEYTGQETSTAITAVDNSANTIAVSVKQTPTKLIIKDNETILASFNGAGTSDQVVDLKDYIDSTELEAVKQQILKETFGYAILEATSEGANKLKFYAKKSATFGDEDALITWKDPISGEVVDGVEISPFIQVQADMAATDSSREEFIKNKETKYILNNGEGINDPNDPLNLNGTNSPYASWHYVKEYGGKIDKIFVNNAEQTIVDKKVYLTVPTRTSDLINNSDFTTTTYVDTQISNVSSTVSTHINNTNNPHAVTKAQIGLNNVDNTADIDKPISSATQSALDLKLDADNADKVITEDFDITTSGDNVSIAVDYVNLANGSESSDTKAIPLATSSNGGLMSSADYDQLRTNTAKIEQLEGQNVRLTYTAGTNPTAAEIEAFVRAEGYTTVSKWPAIGVVVKGTNHIWRYYTNSTAWQDDGIDTVNQFTNTIAGIIKGSATAGRIYAESDGTGSVYGWDNLNNTVTDLGTNKEDKGNKVTSLSASSTDTQYPSAKLVYDQLALKQALIGSTNKLSADFISSGTVNMIPTLTDQLNWNNKSTVDVSSTGTSTTLLPEYMTIDGTEYKVEAGGVTITDL